MAQKTTFVPCKGCHEMVEVPVPEPEKVVETMPCKCGLTESARINKHWAMAIPIIVLFISAALAVGTYLSNLLNADALRKESEQNKADVIKVRSEAEQYRTELDKYKAVLGELKAASPAVSDKFVKPLEKPRD
jgi:hypothetical protein